MDTSTRLAPDTAGHMVAGIGHGVAGIAVRGDSAERTDSAKIRDSLAARAAASAARAVPPADTGPPVEIHHAESKDSFFYLIVAILFYFASIRIFFEKYFSNLMTLFFRVSLRQQQIREQVLQAPLAFPFAECIVCHIRGVVCLLPAALFPMGGGD